MSQRTRSISRNKTNTPDATVSSATSGHSDSENHKPSSSSSEPPPPPPTTTVAPTTTTTTPTSLRSRPNATKQDPPSDETSSSSDSPTDTPKQPLRRASSFSQRTLSQTLQSTANLANLLPTGTLLAFQLLTPIFTNNGSCDSATLPLTIILLLLLASSCFLASFTDSFKSPIDNQVYYGIATFKGLWVLDNTNPAATPTDSSKYKLEHIDWIHAVLSVFVFGAVALRDKNVIGCLYPNPGHETQEVLDIVPIGIGLIATLLFMAFPTKRHGIGFPVSH